MFTDITETLMEDYKREYIEKDLRLLEAICKTSYDFLDAKKDMFRNAPFDKINIKLSGKFLYLRPSTWGHRIDEEGSISILNASRYNEPAVITDLRKEIFIPHFVDNNILTSYGNFFAVSTQSIVSSNPNEQILENEGVIIRNPYFLFNEDASSKYGVPILVNFDDVDYLGGTYVPTKSNPLKSN